MKSRKSRWIPIAIGASLLINLSLLGLATILSHERGLPDDITDPVGISLVSLATPEPPKQEEVKEPEKPKEQQKSDFVPDLIRPSMAALNQLDIGVSVNLGGLVQQDASEEFVFEAFELDQPPRVTVRIPPVYPYKAREQGIEGAVQVKLLINPDGSVGQVMILDARPRGYFEEAVLKSVPQWKFTPGTVEGQSVTAWVVTTIRFQL
jgi:protein TonB